MSQPLPASPADRHSEGLAAFGSPHGGGFIDRARQMVASLAEHDAHAPEHELTAWMERWRGTPWRSPDATPSFGVDELGIIARALNGPPDCTRLRPERTDQLCWLIARCISRASP